MTLTCLLCGADGDVSMRLIAIPQADRRMVSIAIPVDETSRGPVSFDYRDVPERYANEPRCRNAKACAERLAAIVLGEATPPPLPDDDGGPTWLTP